MNDPATLVRVLRSGLEESIHLGHVAVWDAQGRLLAHAGEPEQSVFARSCMKPLQAAVSLSVMGDDAEQLSDREVAVMCASHNGEEVHVATVLGILGRAGLDAEALRNPPGWPLDPDTMANAGAQRRELHNCSGKHAGMVLATVRAGWDRSQYLEATEPLQQRVLQAVLRGTDAPEVRVGIDGCGVPVHGMALSRMAMLFARLADPDRWDALGPFVRRATAAMVSEPYLVAGRKRTDTAVMEVAPNVVVKGGAEGLMCASALDRGLGVAVKVADGTARAAGPALIHALAQLDVLDESQVDRLRPHARPDVLGGGRPAGEIVVSFDLTSD
ncbi:MAG: asparaginase [Actinomycetota bacterium]|nr:asparaginase [Actinomycetota bacterium]